MPDISQEVNFEHLEKLSDGTYKKKNPATKASQVKFADGTTVETHKADIATEEDLGHIRLSDIPPTKGIRVLASDPVNPQEGEMWINSTEEALKVRLSEEIIVVNTLARLPLLNDGYEHVSWINGIKSGSANYSENTSYIYITVNGTNSDVSAVTENVVGLSDVKAIYIDAEGTGSTRVSHRFIAGSTNTSNYASDKDAETVITADFERQIVQLPVTHLDGLYYIRIHCQHSTLSYSVPGTLKIYSVWLVY